MRVAAFRTPLIRLLLPLATALLLAACASTGKRTETAPPPPPPVVAPDQTNDAAKTEKARMRIAVLVPLSGDASQSRIGQALANAAALAIQDLNNARLRLSIYDTATGAEGAARKALGDGAHIILGPLLATDARAVVPLAAAADVPVVSFSNDASVAQPGLYLMGFQPDQAIDRVVNYAAKRGVTAFALLAPGGRYGQAATEAFFSAVRDNGGKVAANQTYARPKDTTERGKLLPAARQVTRYEQRLAAARTAAKPNPDGTIPVVSTKIAPPPFQALMIADTYAWARTFAPTLRTFGVDPTTVRYLGTELWSTDRSAGQDQLLIGGWFASVPDHQFDAMARRYTQLHGARPPRIASMGYDGVLLAASALGNWQPGKRFPAETLRDAGGFSGVDGLFRFRASGIAERGMQVLELTGGGIRVVSSAPSTFGATGR